MPMVRGAIDRVPGEGPLVVGEVSGPRESLFDHRMEAESREFTGVVVR